MQSEIAHKLVQLAQSAPQLPKKGIPPKIKSKKNDELYRFMTLAGLPALGAFLLCISKHIAFFYIFHFVAQIMVVMIGLLVCEKFFSRLIRLKFGSAFAWLSTESNIFQKFAFSVPLVYGLQYAFSILQPHVDNLLQQFHGTLTSHETYSFYISYDTNFYQTWLIQALLFTTIFTVFKWYDLHLQKNTLGDFKLWLGTSTGKLVKNFHGTGLASKQQIALGIEDAAKNIAILGGIGSGKTTRLIQPLLLQLVQQRAGGLVFDIKGNFQVTVKKAFESLSQQRRLVIIGKGYNHINLIEGLTPEVAASFLRSSLLLNTAESSGDKFWLDTATQLCNNILGVLSFFPNEYNLASLYQYIFDTLFRSQINSQADDLIVSLDHHQSRSLTAYRNYYEKVFLTFEEKTINSINASVAQILTQFTNPVLHDLFCRHSDIRLQDMLNGTVFLIDLPLDQWGASGKVAYNMIKLKFFNLMKQRTSELEWNQTHPVFFLCDEYQEIVSGSKDGHSDLNFWDKSRETKTIGIISAQSVSSFYAAIGHRDIANTVLQNFRQKIFFKTEDQATLDLLNDLTGTVSVPQYSVSKQSGMSSGKGFGGQKNTSKTETVSWVTKPVIDPQLVRNLMPEQAIALLTIHGHSCDDVINTMYVN